MMNPLKLSVIVCGAAAGLATAPYIVKQALPPEIAKPETASDVVKQQVAKSPVAQDLPVSDSSNVLKAVTVPSEVVSTPAQVVSHVQSTPAVISSPAPVSEFIISTPSTQVVATEPKEYASLPSLTAPVSAKPQVETEKLPVPAVIATPTPVPTATPIPFRADVAEAQKLLNKLGYNIGNIDGKLGPKTNDIISGFQQKSGMTTTGDINPETIEKLKAASAQKEAEDKAAQIAKAEEDAKKAKEELEAKTVAIVESSLESSETLELPKQETSETVEIAKADLPDMVMVRKGSLEETETVDDSESKDTKPEIVSVDAGPVPKLNSMADVKRIQERLIASNVYEGDADGKWGKLTIDALKSFQEKNGLEVTGKPNKESWTKLNSESNSSSNDLKTNVVDAESIDLGPVPTLNNVEDVKKIQAKLSEANVYEGATDGKWGKLTIDAMKVYQEKNGLDVTGKPNEATWKQMNQVATAKDTKKSSAVIKTKANAIEVADIGPVPGLDSISDIKKVQEKLIEAGVYDGNVDGKWGNKTSDAMRKFQKDNDLEVTGKPNLETWGKLNSRKSSSLRIAKDSKSDKNDTVVVLNSDGATKSKVKAIATPKAVSETAKVSVKKNEINKQLEETKARIESVNNSHDLDTYAPKSLNSLNNLMEKLNNDLSSDDVSSEETKQSLKRINDELEKATVESKRKRADQKVGKIENSYKTVKNQYSRYIKSIPTGTSSERDKKEKLQTTMGKIDDGFTAMKSDFKNEKYDPIIDLCDGFQIQIGMFANQLSEGYLSAELSKKAVSGKLSKSTLNEIESLRKKNLNVEAAQLLESETKKEPNSTSKKTDKKG